MRKFKVGDRVKCNKGYMNNQIGTVTKVTREDQLLQYILDDPTFKPWQGIYQVKFDDHKVKLWRDEDELVLAEEEK